MNRTGNAPIPATKDEALQRGWDRMDIVLVTGDPHVDHAAFPANLLARVLEAEGYQVGIISRPAIDNLNSIETFGKPRLFFGVTAGTMDSMVANYTALKRIRSDDPFSPDGKARGRPDRAVTRYCNLIRGVYKKSVFVVAGGIEASLRRIAHYDYWSDSIRRPLLMDCGADILVHGMGEKPILNIAQELDSFLEKEKFPDNASLVKILKKVRGVVYRVPKSQAPPVKGVELPSMEQVVSNPETFSRMHKLFESSQGELQWQNCSGMRIILNPPATPMTCSELDKIYNLPFSRNPHPIYGKARIPALEQVRFSVTSHRGCVGGCAFCSIGVHQGKTITSRSVESITEEIEAIVSHPEFKGTINDIGGPSANMYGFTCGKEDGTCNRPSCLTPLICKHLKCDQTRYLALLHSAESVAGVKHLFVTTGVRTDLAIRCEPLIEKLTADHTSGLLKVAPEHAVSNVLRLMRKPGTDSFLKFTELFKNISAKSKKEQYVVPYMIAAHPGSDMKEMVEACRFLKSNNLKVEQCQIFTPTPGTASTAMYATGLDPSSGKRVYVEKTDKKKKLQKALLLYHLPENRRLAGQMLKEYGDSGKSKIRKIN